MAQQYVNFTTDRNETFSKVLVLKNSDNSLVDLTGYEYQLTICVPEIADSNFTVISGHIELRPADGEIEITLEESDYPIANINDYNLKQIAPDGKIENILSGLFVIREQCHG